jgi:predicted GIY-YIG superfamily endonuclease
MLLRDQLLERLAEMGAQADYSRLAADVLGVQNAPPELAKRLVAQALVMEDRQHGWRRLGERVASSAPVGPGVYILRDAAGKPLYVGKAVNLRRRLRSHFAARRWPSVKAELARAVDAEWVEVGSELEALLREAALITELQPVVNVQVGLSALRTRNVPDVLLRDVLLILPSVDPKAAELVAARVDGGCVMLRTRRDGTELRAHAQRLLRLFLSVLPGSDVSPLAPIVFSWLARRGRHVSRLDPHDVTGASELRARLSALLADDQLFTARIVVR